ncbi:hypothetical protein ACH4ZU_25965 [Streptomyces sp. NPDC020472]|uniref:hypothetical protein n=1 Tax=Streptomyces sp. NPDC020472 TaxID=3365075 RepID=UPI00378D6650
MKEFGDAEGTRALTGVPLMGRRLTHEHIVAGRATAPRAGALNADAVALEARKTARAEDGPTTAELSAARPATGPGAATVTFLNEWKPDRLPPDTNRCLR